MKHLGKCGDKRAFSVIVGLIVALLMTSASAGEQTGPVTNLPLPRFVSLKAAEGNVRRGPSLTHRIDWVYKRRNMPLRITAEHGRNTFTDLPSLGQCQQQRPGIAIDAVL